MYACVLIQRSNAVQILTFIQIPFKLTTSTFHAPPQCVSENLVCNIPVMPEHMCALTYLKSAMACRGKENITAAAKATGRAYFFSLLQRYDKRACENS